eukprot:287959-Chlamydomonas_euryale.AAC.3
MSAKPAPVSGTHLSRQCSRRSSTTRVHTHPPPQACPCRPAPSLLQASNLLPAEPLQASTLTPAGQPGIAPGAHLRRSQPPLAHYAHAHALALR